MYNNILKIAENYVDYKGFPLPTIEESLKFASEQILEGYKDESEALYDIEMMEDTGNVRFSGYGYEFKSSDVRAALDLNEKFGWNLINQ